MKRPRSWEELNQEILELFFGNKVQMPQHLCKEMFQDRGMEFSMNVGDKFMYSIGNREIEIEVVSDDY